jgi:hypothetical protein
MEQAEVLLTRRNMTEDRDQGKQELEEQTRLARVRPDLLETLKSGF